MTTILRLPGTDPAELTVPGLLLRNAEDHGDLPALSWRTDEDDPASQTTLTWGEVRHRVAELAAGYAALGVSAGDHVLLLMANRPEHWLSDLALVHLGAVPVSVYRMAAPEQLAHIVRHSRARLAVAGTAAEAECFAPLLGAAGARLERLVVADQDPGSPQAVCTACTAFSALARPYEEAVFEEAWRSVRAPDPVTVVYTSGTTGDPKGVVISHRNVILNALALDRVTGVPDHVDHLSYLPFAHIAERMLGIYLAVFRASHVHLCADLAEVGARVRTVRPAQFFGVPRIWEKLAAAMRAALDGLPPERRAAIEEAGDTARAHVEARERGERPSAELEAAYRAARREVLDPALAGAGLDRLVWTASASAPMPPKVTRFWAGFGIVIMDAWGLTETTGVVTTNGHDAFRLGSVGRPLEGLEVRTAADGEIEVRGPTLFAGYLRADGSVEPDTDAGGWFATGDIGRIDEDGYLWVTDRKKEMIVTSTGKNVSPALVENALKEHPLVGQALVHGDGRPYLVALLVPDPEAVAAWTAARQSGPDGPEAVRSEAVRAELDRAVAWANAHLGRAEQVGRYRVLDEEWGPGTGELTPSLKLRRAAIRAKYAREIDALYE